MEDKKTRLDNTIKLVAEVLEENKDNPELKEVYERINALKEKRNLK